LPLLLGRFSQIHTLERIDLGQWPNLTAYLDRLANPAEGAARAESGSVVAVIAERVVMRGMKPVMTMIVTRPRRFPVPGSVP
jgi:hypothetical protein